jgi:hypothetical protein
MKITGALLGLAVAAALAAGCGSAGPTPAPAEPPATAPAPGTPDPGTPQPTVPAPCGFHRTNAMCDLLELNMSAPGAIPVSFTKIIIRK